MKLSNAQYDVIKFVLLIVVPATITLIEGLGHLYNYNTGILTGTITLFATFFASILMSSSKKYHAEEEGE